MLQEKSFFLLVFLFRLSVGYGQDIDVYTSADSNNIIEYIVENNDITNISNEFVFYTNPILNRELLTFKTNRTVLTNEDGIYHLNITFHKDNNSYPSEKKMIMNFILQTKFQLMSYDTFGQKMAFIMVGQDNKIRWEMDFYFDKNQANFSRTGKVYTYYLTKRLSFWDREKLYKILNSNEKIYFQVKGLTQNFYFLFNSEINNFYKSFFNYAESLSFYE